jgi:hypothetical protein
MVKTAMSKVDMVQQNMPKLVLYADQSFFALRIEMAHN